MMATFTKPQDEQTFAVWIAADLAFECIAAGGARDGDAANYRRSNPISESRVGIS